MELHDDRLDGTSSSNARHARGELDVSREAPDTGTDAIPAILGLQRDAGNATVSRLLGEGDEPREVRRSPVLDVVGRGGGDPLPPVLRREMEERLGHDFSDVRIHRGGSATDSARSVDAQAYTVGRDVVFRDDRWAPDTESGKRTLAHELTHVVQQAAGPVPGSAAGGGIRISDPDDPFERAAEHAADRAMAGSPPTTPHGVQLMAVQRQGEEEEEELQAMAVQREGEEEEEELQAMAVQREGEEEEEELQAMAVQREGEEEEEELQALRAGD